MILVIGYGNPLRTDDGIGPCLVQMLEARLKLDAVQFMTVYQLTPEVVEPISHVELVIFIDARVGPTPCMMMQEVVDPEMGQMFTHHVRPGTLLGAACELYGTTPEGLLISVVGADFEYGGELSPELQRKLPELADQIEGIIRLKYQQIHEAKEAHDLEMIGVIAEPD